MSDIVQMRERVVRELEKDKDSSPWTLKDFMNHHARTWDLYEEQADYLDPGEVVCRHVALECGIEAAQRGNRYRVDVFALDTEKLSRMYGPDASGIYGSHATFCVEIEGKWYYIDSAYSSLTGKHNAYWREVPAHDDPDFEGLPMTSDGKVDAEWMSHLPMAARMLSNFLYCVSSPTDGDVEIEIRWLAEYLKSRLTHVKQLRSGTAEEKVGRGKGKRKVLA